MQKSNDTVMYENIVRVFIFYSVVSILIRIGQYELDLKFDRCHKFIELIFAESIQSIEITGMDIKELEINHDAELSRSPYIHDRIRL